MFLSRSSSREANTQSEIAPPSGALTENAHNGSSEKSMGAIETQGTDSCSNISDTLLQPRNQPNPEGGSVRGWGTS